MHFSVEKLNIINKRIKEIIYTKQLKISPNIIAVSKTFPIENILPLLEAGHMHFGENKLQEAEEKWKNIRKKYNKLQLHMIGKLQSNKAKKAVSLFDYIHSLDSEKLANKINQYQKELNKNVKLFIQINFEKESQKSGISINELDDFYSYCTKSLSLNIIGLMCLPPINLNPDEYFKNLSLCAKKINLNDLSMGMSSDYETALKYGSTYLRLGTMIFGQRN